MKSQLCELAGITIQAVPDSHQYLTSLVGNFYLSMADIGTAELPDGTAVYITWGRNLTKKEQEHCHMMGLQPIHLNAFAGEAELIIPDHVAAVLLQIASNKDNLEDFHMLKEPANQH